MYPIYYPLKTTHNHRGLRFGLSFIPSQACDLAKDRSFDMSSIEGAEPMDPSKGLEKLLREMGDVTCDYSINPPPWCRDVRHDLGHEHELKYIEMMDFTSNISKNTKYIIVIDCSWGKWWFTRQTRVPGSGWHPDVGRAVGPLWILRWVRRDSGMAFFAVLGALKV